VTTNSVGEVVVDVTADASAFATKLRAQLKTLTKKLSIRIPVKAITTPAGAKIAAWRKKMMAKAITLRVAISKKSLAVATAQLKGITGTTALQGEITGFSDAFQGFFDNLPKTARKTLKFTSIIALASHAIGAFAISIASMGPAMAGLGGVLASIPGLFMAAGLSVVALVVAMKNMPQDVKDSISAYSDLKAVITDNFWAGAADQMKSMFDTLHAPIKAGMGLVAKDMGEFSGAFSAALEKALGGGALDIMFENMSKGFDAFKPAIVPLAEMIKNLGLLGTSVLPAVNKWMGDLVIKFNNWLEAGLEDGTILDNMRMLGKWLQAVGAGFSGLWGILKGIAKAAGAAGIGGLFEPLQKISEIVNSPKFQSALTLFFAGAAEGSRGLLSALGPIGNMLANLMPVLSGFLADAGTLLGSLFSSLADEMSKPIFKEGLGAFFEGILKFIEPLIPVLPMFIDKIASVGELAGKILEQLGPIIATALENLVPILDKVLDAVGPLVEALGPVIAQVFEALAPVLDTAVDLFLPIVDALGAVMPYLGDFIEALLSSLIPAFDKVVPIIDGFMKALLPIVKIILDVLTPLIEPLVAVIVMLATIAIEPLTTTLEILGNVMAAMEPTWKLLSTVIGAVIGTIVALFNGDFKKVGEIWSGVWDGMVEWWNSLKPIFAAIGTFFEDLWNGIVSFVTDRVNAAKAVIKLIVGAISTWWNETWSAISTFFTDIWEAIVTWVTDRIEAVQAVIKLIVTAIQTKWEEVWGAISSFVTDIWEAIVNWVDTKINMVKRVIALVIGNIKRTWDSVWGAISGFITTTWDNITGGVQTGIDSVFGFIDDVMGNIQKVWDDVWGGLGATVEGIWGGIKTFIKNGINGVIDIINGFIDGINVIADGANAVTGGKVDLHVNRLPHLAQGATILPRSGGTAAILGEGGRAESVVDTGLMNTLLRKVLRDFPRQVAAMNAKFRPDGLGLNESTGMRTTNNNREINVIGTLHPERTARAVQNALAERVVVT